MGMLSLLDNQSLTCEVKRGSLSSVIVASFGAW